MEPIRAAADTPTDPLITIKTEKPADRITLGKSESEKVIAWIQQINSSSKGFLSLSKSDVVNFIIRSFKDIFTAKEIQCLRADNYDPIKHLSWIAPQIKRALADKNFERVSELQEELRGVELSAIETVQKRTNSCRGRKPKSRLVQSKKSEPHESLSEGEKDNFST